MKGFAGIDQVSNWEPLLASEISPQPNEAFRVAGKPNRSRRMGESRMKECVLPLWYRRNVKSVRYAHTAGANSNVRVPIGAVFISSAGVGRELVATARTKRSLPATLRSTRLGKRRPLSFRASLSTPPKNMTRLRGRDHQTSTSGVRARTLSGRISGLTCAPRPWARVRKPQHIASRIASGVSPSSRHYHLYLLHRSSGRTSPNCSSPWAE